MWVNPNEIASNGVDDDGNGVVDDVHGFNAATGSGDPMDVSSHGTACAGVLGAVGDNGIGVVGVNWNVSIMAISYLTGDGGGGSAADAIAAIDYAVGMRNAGVNLRVLSNSWGGQGYSLALQDAIEAANAADILFVAAAGNAGRSNDATDNPLYPASYPQENIISVASTDSHDDLLSYSNYGATTVDLAAPGADILTTVPGDGYEPFNGTTMSTPFVAGAAALLLSINQSLSTAQVKQLLLSTGDPLPPLAGITVSGRRLNVANALLAAGPPEPDFDVSAGPPRGFVNQEGTARFETSIGSRGGFDEEVQLSVTSIPPIDAVITAAPVTAPGTTTISVATSQATAPGLYTLTIAGQSGGVIRRRAVSLLVRPLGSLEHEFLSTDTPAPIPAEYAGGLSSVIQVGQAIDVSDVEIDLDMSHYDLDGLQATLISPSGTRVVLHGRGMADQSSNLRRTYAVPTALFGEQAFGDWTLYVDDVFDSEVGVLNSWTLRIFGKPSAPTFLLALDQASLQVVQNRSAQATLEVTPLVGFDEEISLSATASPSLAGALSFSPPILSGGGASNLTISPSCDAPPGLYEVTVRATSGDILREQRLTVEVFSFGSTTLELPSADTPLPIPDNDETGVSSHIEVRDSFPIEELQVEVHIFHAFSSDLTIELIGPNGEVVLLRDINGRRGPIHETYTVTAFDGLLSSGRWSLRVRDLFAFDQGELDSWILKLIGPGALPEPVAAFTSELDAASRQVSFTDASTGSACGGGGLTAWTWSFGDGATSSERHPTHTYATGGSYDVTLTVTDTSGATATTTQRVVVSQPPVLSIERVLRNRTTFEFLVDLTWTNAQGAQVELHRNGVLVDLPNNDGAHRDQFRRYDTAFTWKLCELRSPNCSNEVSVVFGTSTLGGDGAPVEATIVERRADGSERSRAVKIEDAPDHSR